VPEVSDEEVTAQIDRVRTQYAELEDVERPADEGDFVMINLSAAGPLGDIAEVSATDLLYEVGSRSYIPGLDEMLTGAAAGAIQEGPATLPEGFGDHSGREVTLRVLVKGVKARKLPELTDEWVSDVSEYETLSELEDELRRGLLSLKLETARGMFRDKLLGELIDDLGLDVPDALIQAEMESSFHNLSHSLESRGLDLGTYLSVTGQDQQAFVDDLREGAERSITTRVLLEGVAGVEGLAVDDAEVDAAIAGMAASSGRPPDELRATLESSGQLSVLTGDILRRKALDRILEASTAVDADGDPIELTIPDDSDEEIDGDEVADHGDAVEEAGEITDVAGDQTPTSASVGREGADPDADEDS
jgi:trigger factor